MTADWKRIENDPDYLATSGYGSWDRLKANYNTIDFVRSQVSLNKSDAAA
jgi:hypothetical protein